MQDAAHRHPASVLAAIAVGCWTVVVCWFWQVLAWGYEQYRSVLGLPMPPWGWPLACLLIAALITAPAAVLATFAGTPGIRIAGALWMRAALALVILGAAQAVPLELNWVYLLTLAAAAAVAALLVVRLPGPAVAGLSPDGTAAEAIPLARGGSQPVPQVLLAGAAGMASLLAWLWLGALGTVVDLVAAVLAAAGLGWVVAVLIDSARPLTRRGGVAALPMAVAMVPVAAATGASLIHLASMLALPPLGLALAGLRRLGPSRRAALVLVGLGSLGPLAFVDPVQTSIVLGLRDVGYWTGLASLVALGIAALVGAAYLIFIPWPRPGSGGRARAAKATGVGSRVGTAIAASLATASLLAGAGLYLAAGHPGFYGDELFVVMKAQADLSGLDQIADITARRAATYRRLVGLARSSQTGLRHDLDRLRVRYTPYYLIDAVLVDAGPQLRGWLSARPDVDRVLLAPRLRPLPRRAPSEVRADASTPDGTPQWNISMIHADQVWATGDTGSGIVIGSSDTGVDAAHPALAGSFRGGSDSWYDPWNGSLDPIDHNGHGTHTIGTALGRDGIGVAPGAQWIGCVNLDRNLGNPAWYLDCLQFMLAPFALGTNPFTDGNPARAADVLTNSWGCPPAEGCDLAALSPAIDALSAAGIFVVAAAGNTGPACATITDPPAPYPDTFTVGAVDSTGRLAPFSSRGPTPDGLAKPDLVAPGVAVLSATPDGGYARLDGTSMATPHVAGVVALMWSANPHLVGDIGATAQILRASADPVSSVGRCGAADGVGAGLLDAAAAVRAARAAG